MVPAPVLNAPRAHAHVGGPSIRVKAEPTKLTRLAGRVMCASGNFSTRRAAARESSALFGGALAVFLIAAGALALGSARLDGRAAQASGMQIAIPDRFYTLGVGEYAAPAGEAAPALAAEDRGEIERFFRLAARANARLAPAAGPPRR